MKINSDLIIGDTNTSLNDLLQPKGKVLWTNPKPSAEMGEGYTINLSSNDYDEIEWIFAYNAGSNYQTSTTVTKGKSVLVCILGYNNPTPSRRILEYVNDKKYSAKSAYWNSDLSASHLIPLYAIGWKY